MISRVRLKNWKSHLESDFQFTEGMNALIGIMGSGKSSVMDAISFGLFGTFPLHNVKKISLDDVIMKRPHLKDDAEVSIDFAVDGKAYTVVRKIKKGKGTSSAEIRQDGKLIDVNPDNVTRFVEQALQIDYNTFSKAVYSEQNNIDYFLTVPKGRRMQYIDKMLRLDIFEAVRENATKIRNSIATGQKEKIKLLSEFDMQEIKVRMDMLKEEISSGLVEQNRIKFELEETKVKAKDISGWIKKIEGEMDELALNKSIAGNLDQLCREIENNILHQRSKIDVVNVDGMEKNMESLKKQLADVKASIKQTDSELSSKRDELAETNIKIRAIERHDLPEATKRQKQLETYLDTLAKLGSGKELAEKIKEADMLKHEATMLETESKDISDTLNLLAK